MGEPTWFWAAVGSGGWAEERPADPASDSVLAHLLDEVRHWTNNSDPAFLLWSRGGRLYGCVTDLRTGGVDRHGRPARARGFVVAEDDAVETALRQVATLITAGLPDGYIVPDAASTTGFTVTRRHLPRARFKSGDRVWPNSDRRQFLPSVEPGFRSM